VALAAECGEAGAREERFAERCVGGGVGGGGCEGLSRPGTNIDTCVLQCVAVCCSVLQRVAACCSVLQCVAVF